MPRNLVRAFVVVPLATLAYALALHWVYTTLILDAFSYVGYTYHAALPQIMFLCWLEVVIVGGALPPRASKPSDVLLWILFVVVVAPTMLMLPYLGPMSDSEGLGFSTGIGGAFLIAVLIARRKRNVTPLPISASRTTFWMLVTVFSAVVYVYIALTTGISLDLPALSEVYEVRSDYKEALAESTLLGYLVSTQGNVVNPLLVARGLQSKRWGIVALAVVGQLVLFSATGFKTLLFSLIAIPIVAWIFRASPRPRLIVFLWGASGLLIVTAVVDILLGTIFWSSLFGRRFLFTPARLSGLYFEWYSNHPLSLMANSILAPFIETDYAYGPARTISLYATGSADSSMNANVFATGFAEFGWFGLALVAVVLGIYLRVLDRAAHGVPLGMAAIVSIMPAITLSNTAIHTSMLSHGLVAALLLLAIVPRQASSLADPPSRSKFIQRLSVFRSGDRAPDSEQAGPR